MGMSTHVMGIKPPDATWKQMKDIWDSCTTAGIDIPDTVLDFFDGEPPDDKGVIVHTYDNAAFDAAVPSWGDDSRAGYEIHVDKLPKDIKIVRVYNSW